MVAANDRVPCPQCGNLIHPISGRCKHCKADLAASRGARITAPTALPALIASVTPVPASAEPVATPAPLGAPWAPPARQPYSPTPVPGAPTAPLAREDSRPVLPPRVTARQIPTAEPAARAWWKSWPILVIIVASLAIVVAILLLVVPGTHKAGGTKGGDLGPAPDRMDTGAGENGPSVTPPPNDPSNNGAAPGSKKDPWDGKADPKPDVPADPNDPNPAQPRTRPAPPDPVSPSPIDPDPDDDNVLGGILGGGGGAQGGANTNPLGNLGALGLGKAGGMMSAMLQHGCARVSSCSATDPMMRAACGQLGPMLSKLPKDVPSCAAAQRCLDQIDALDCTTKLDDLGNVLSLQTKIGDCVDALQCT